MAGSATLAGQPIGDDGTDSPLAEGPARTGLNLGTIAPNQTKKIDLSLVSPARGPLNCHATVTFTAPAV